MIKFGSTAYKVIERYVRNLLATPDAQGIMRIESNQVVTKSAQDLAAKLNSYGVPESVIVNTDDVKNFAGQIANIEQQKAMQAFKKQMTPKKSADIVELKTGKKIDQSKGIMGGRQFPESEAEIKTKIDKSNKETIARMKMVDDAIDDAAEGFVMGDNKYNAELVAENLAQRRGLVYDDLSTRERAKIYGEAFDALSKKFRDDLAVGGRAGFSEGTKKITLSAKGSRSGKQQIQGAPEGVTMDSETFNAIVNADIPITEKIDLLANLEYGKGRTRIEKDGQEIFMDEGGFKDRDIGLGFNKEGQGIGGTLTYNLETGKPEFKIGFRKKFSKGSKGSMSRRKFLQMLGGLAALPVVGKFFKGAKIASKAAPVIEKTTSSPPSYFFDLVNKIKILGDEGKSISPRTKTTTYKNYELQEDLTTGDIVVIKQKGDPDFNYEEEVLSFRKGQADETTKGKTPPDEYDEYTVRPDMDGKMKDVDDGIEPEGIKEILEEVGPGGGNVDELTLQEIKQGKLASGGIAKMLGE